MASRRRWKRQELEIARTLGTERNPCTGKPHADCDTPLWSVEVKTRAKLPLLVTSAMSQAAAACKEGQTPIVVLSEVTQGRKAVRYVVMRFGDWQDCLGPISGSPE